MKADKRNWTFEVSSCSSSTREEGENGENGENGEGRGGLKQILKKKGALGGIENYEIAIADFRAVTM